jgi:hypothetical protein
MANQAGGAARTIGYLQLFLFFNMYSFIAMARHHHFSVNRLTRIAVAGQRLSFGLLISRSME